MNFKALLMAQMKWKIKEEMEAEKTRRKKKTRETPTLDERIEMLEQAILILSME
ncbi:hypothetical protein AB4027_07270 [Alkalibacterium putridalgicola]|uniref:hypothetical protein n=1 Tax=Alkalibacterium putridalgicola TaxID=426703 RepID=UPI0034CF3338